jgi:hypothetical protein
MFNIFNFKKDKSGLSRKEITHSKKMHKFIIHNESDLQKKKIIIANNIYILSCKRLKINSIAIEEAKGFTGNNLIDNITNDYQRILHRKIIEITPVDILIKYTIENRNDIDDTFKTIINTLIEETVNALMKVQ